MAEREVQLEEIPGGWAAHRGRLTAHGDTREEALKKLRAVLRIVEEHGHKQARQ